MTTWTSGSLTTFAPVGRHQRARDFVRREFVERLDGDFADGDLDAEARGHERAIVLQRVKHAAAHRAAADHAEIDLLHNERTACRETGRGTIQFWPHQLTGTVIFLPNRLL